MRKGTKPHGCQEGLGPHFNWWDCGRPNLTTHTGLDLLTVLVDSLLSTMLRACCVITNFQVLLPGAEWLSTFEKVVTCREGTP